LESRLSLTGDRGLDTASAPKSWSTEFLESASCLHKGVRFGTKGEEKSWTSPEHDGVGECNRLVPQCGAQRDRRVPSPFLRRPRLMHRRNGMRNKGGEDARGKMSGRWDASPGRTNIPNPLAFHRRPHSGLKQSPARLPSYLWTFSRTFIYVFMTAKCVTTCSYHKNTLCLLFPILMPFPL
jgi:hypothetical protein